MKSVGLITEYNPFHSGHLYHAQQAKKLSNADITVALMSGHFVMRGEPAIYNKFLRTRMALTEVDLVVELPLIASISSADHFAEMGIKLANYLNIDAIAFGSENANMVDLTDAAENIITLKSNPKFKQLIKEGMSFPRILNELSNKNEILQSPNNLLGISYINAIQQYAPNIDPIAIQRQAVSHHDTHIHHNHFASATSIRQAIYSEDEAWEDVVPKQIIELYETPHLIKENLFKLIKYALISSSSNDLVQIYTMDEGLEHRLKKYILESNNLKQFMELIKTKRYTYTHLQRVLINVLLNIKKTDISKDIQAARILGMNHKGREYLKQLKTKFPNRQYITNINKSNKHLFGNEIKATQIYNLLSNQTQTDFDTPVFIAK